MVARIVVAVGLFGAGWFMIRFAHNIVEVEFWLPEQEAERPPQDPNSSDLGRFTEAWIEAFRVPHILLIALVDLLVGIGLMFLALSIVLDRPLVRGLF